MKKSLAHSLLALGATFAAAGCSTTGDYRKTVDKVEISKFMGSWYVLAGRFTFFERDVHNAVERYTWNDEAQRIDVDFTYREGSLTGRQRAIPQKAWIHDAQTGAHWKVSPFWPLRFDYLVVALGRNYRWTAIGVPSQKYLWIMARDWRDPEPTIAEAVRTLKAAGYNTDNVVRVPQQW